MMTLAISTMQPVQPANGELLALLARSAEGDQTAFQSLYHRTAPQLLGVLRRILRIEAIAEEALQETYVKIWHNAGSYDTTRGAPLTWMTSVARYHALDTLRRRQNREDLETTWLPDVEPPQASSNILLDDQLAAQEVLTICLDQLDDRVKSCILKAYCEGYSHEELSQTKGAPLGTVKSWIRRGLLALRECVDGLS